MMKTNALLSLLVLSINPVIAEEVNLKEQLPTPPPLTSPSPYQLAPPAPKYFLPARAINTPYIGFGWKRTVQLLEFPVVHPIQFCNNCTFPARHPLIAYQKAGDYAQPYQPALNATAAIGCIATPFTTGFVYRR